MNLKNYLEWNISWKGKFFSTTEASYNNYLRDEEVSLEEKLSKAERDAILEKKRLKKFYETRNTEITRARTAQILFQTERETQSRMLAQRTGTDGFIDINKLSESYDRREKFSKRMGVFGLKKPTTRIPSIDSSITDRKTQVEVRKDLFKHRNSCTILPPPVSVRQTWEIKGKEFRDAKMDRGSARSNESGP